MDSSITLSYGSKTTSTRISNNFIDNYMTDARGSDVKVYIYLLRCFQDPTMQVNISAIAEALDETEKDVRTALKYWDKQNVLSVSSTRGKITNITLHDVDETEEPEEDDDIELTSDSGLRRTPASAPASVTEISKAAARKRSSATPEPAEAKAAKAEPSRPTYNDKAILNLRSNEDFDQLLDYIENALGRTLTKKTLQTPCFLFEDLGFSGDLICFLYDYCLEASKKNNPDGDSTRNIESYVEAIARDWHSKGIQTREAAEAQIKAFNSKFSGNRPAEKKKNMMQQFAQRSYTQEDFDELERRKLKALN